MLRQFHKLKKSSLHRQIVGDGVVDLGAQRFDRAVVVGFEIVPHGEKARGVRQYDDGQIERAADVDRLPRVAAVAEAARGVFPSCCG